MERNEAADLNENVPLVTILPIFSGALLSPSFQTSEYPVNEEEYLKTLEKVHHGLIVGAESIPTKNHNNESLIRQTRTGFHIPKAGAADRMD